MKGLIILSKLKDLTGQRFGRLTVISRAENKNGYVYWKCRCDCGAKVVVSSTHLISNHTRSCGCIRTETIAALNISHKMTNTKFYSAWLCIKQRCLNPKSRVYKYYGGRGITMFPEWIDDFLAFYNYVSTLEHFGEEGYSLDRINNNGNYEPGNLRWATVKEQSRNRNSNVIVEYNGEQMTLIDASEKSKIPYGTLMSRMRRGDTDERLFRPVKKH